MNDVLFALALTLFAGLSTGIGSIIAFTVKPTNYRFLSVATGFSAGVMLYVSFVEILVKGEEYLAGHYGEELGAWINVGSFFAGMLVIGLIDNLVPAGENPHETHSVEESLPLQDSTAPVPNFAVTVADENLPAGVHDHRERNPKLMRMGLFTALAIGIHNFPEGLATFLAALDDPTLGVAIAIAIALHNIPEGVSVSVPIYYATGDRKKAFLYSLSSGLAEPVGALFAYLLIMVFLGGGEIPTHFMGLLFGGVAGTMVYISVDELLPTSQAYGKGHDSIFGLIGGMVVMAISLLIL